MVSDVMAITVCCLQGRRRFKGVKSSVDFVINNGRPAQMIVDDTCSTNQVDTNLHDLLQQPTVLRMVCPRRFKQSSRSVGAGDKPNGFQNI
jgi:hypothetical protein